MSQSRVIQESRAYDYAYDPVHHETLRHSQFTAHQPWNSSGRPQTLAKTLPRTKGPYRTQQAAAESVIVPVEMPGGHVETLNFSSPQRGTAPISADVRAERLQAEIMGKSRVKYFKRPLIPYLPHSLTSQASQSTLVNPHLPFTASNSLELDEIPAKTTEILAATREIGTQSVYRESETQTDPFSPDFITDPQSNSPSELLDIAHFTVKNGNFPISQQEINEIHRIREKKAFEASLPPINDVERAGQRRRMLADRELLEWEVREEQLKAEQGQKLQQLVDILAVREQKSSEYDELRLDLAREEAQISRENYFEQIHRERIKLQRLLKEKNEKLVSRTAKMSGGTVDLTRSLVSNRPAASRDIINDYSQYNSSVYAPITREGKLPIRNNVINYEIPALSNVKTIENLAETLPEELQFSQESQVSAPQQVLSRQGAAIAADLDYLDALLHSKLAENKPKLIENVYKRFEPLVRAPTPTVESNGEALVNQESEENRAIILLQRLLRGRRQQLLMAQGRAHNLQLIKELQGSESVPGSATAPGTSIPAIIRPARAEHLALDSLQGVLISGALDFLSKEVIRVEEENQVNEQIKAAESLRRRREAEEAGRRQAEALITQRNEQIYSNIMAQHQLSAKNYLRTQLAKAISQHTAQEAQLLTDLHINQLEQQLLQPTEAKFNNEKVIINQIVADFVLPEVVRREKLEKNQRETDTANIEAAQQAIGSALTQALRASTSASSNTS
jgi:hypothetical protein